MISSNAKAGSLRKVIRKMGEPCISFYLKAHRIYVHFEALRAIGCPNRICFMISEKGDRLLMMPYGKRDLVSHKVPERLYEGTNGFDISSYKLCSLLAELHGWDLNKSYRILGNVAPKYSIIIYDLTKVRIIDNGHK